MASFDKPDALRSDPWGKNEYLRSTKGNLFTSATVHASTVTAETFKDGQNPQNSQSIKILQSGEVIAKITSGPNSGYFGPFQTGATDGRADVANIAGINDTYNPDQFNRRNVDCAVLYKGTVLRDRIFIRDANGKRVVATDAVVNALRGTAGLDILVKS